MKNSSIIGLKEADCKKIAEKLNVLLANYSVFYQNTRGAHWNIKGNQFFTLHPKFEELYNGLVLKIDAIAERILTLGAAPAHNYSEYLKVSTIKESSEVSDANKCVEGILASFKIVILSKYLASNVYELINGVPILIIRLIVCTDSTNNIMSLLLRLGSYK